MSFPTSPTDGQIHDKYKYSTTTGSWNKNKDVVVNTLNTTGTTAFTGKRVGPVGNEHVVYAMTPYKAHEHNINSGSCYNAATGEFTAKYSGRHFITWNGLILTGPQTALSYGYLRFYVNDIDVSGVCHSSYNILRDYQPLSSGMFVDLNVGDRLACKINTPGGGAVYGSQYTGMSVTYVR